MTLRSKTLLITVLTMIALTLAIYFMAASFVLYRARLLEEREVKGKLVRARVVLREDLNDLRSTTRDWAHRDDTYQFFRGRDNSYLARNLIPGQLHALNVNLVAYVDPEGQLRYGRCLPLENQVEAPISRDTWDRLSGYLAPKRMRTAGEKSGLIEIAHEPMLVTAVPVLAGRGAEQSQGTLIMGRYLGKKEFQRISSLIDADITLTSTAGQPKVVRSSVRRVNLTTIDGTSFVNEIGGYPGFRLQIRTTRTAYLQALMDIIYLLVAILLIGLLFSAVHLIFFERLVLARLSRLGKAITDMDAQGDLSERIPVSGNDELSRVATAVNTMIATLEKAVHEQQESEARYHAVVEQASEAVILFDPEMYMVIEANSAALDLLGYTHEEICALTLFDFALYRQESLASRIDTILPRDTHYASEQRARRKDGSLVDVEVNIGMIAYGEREAYCFVARDITERKRVEAQLRQRQREVVALLDNLPAAAYVKDSQSRFLMANRLMCKYVGCSLQEIVGKTDFDFFPPYLAGKYSADDQRVFESRQQMIIGEEELLDCGQLISVLTRKMPLTGDQGEIIGLVGLSMDITEQKWAAAELAAEKERLAITLRSIGDGVITTDRNGNVSMLNAVAESLTGWMHEEAIGRPLAEIFDARNQKTGRRYKDLAERITSDKRAQGIPDHLVLIARDGTERIIAESGTPICDRESHVIGMVLVFRDVTGQLRLEEELRKADKMESIGILAGGIAHDFNNLLAAILGNITLAAMYAPPGSPILQRLTEAERASTRAKDLTRQLLTFAKGGAPVKHVTSLGNIAREATSFALTGSSVRCEIDIPDDLWPAEVDEGQINQVVHNLVINADQAMPDGGRIVIKAENCLLAAYQIGQLPAGPYVKLSVEDQGIGIPPENQSKVFDPYFTTKKTGSGLGLPSSYSIISNHGGDILLRSTPGEGTSFTIYLPAVPDATIPAVNHEVAVVVTDASILVLDDEAIILEMLQEMLTMLGYRVETCSDGVDVIARYREALVEGKPFDLVVMDLTIPGGMGGKEAIEQLLQIDPQVKAIASSGYSNAPVMSDYRTYGFSGVLAKPYRIDELRKTIKDVLDKVRSR